MSRKFLLKLELRPLMSEYVKEKATVALKVMDRVDVGSTGAEIRYASHSEAMWRVVEVALSCTETYSAYRPSMVDIVRELEDALIIENNASEYMKSIDSFGGSNRFSIERPIAIPPTPVPTEPSPIPSQQFREA